MLLKELILTGPSDFDSYKIYGKDLSIKGVWLDIDLYLEYADNEVEKYYLDIDKDTNQPFMQITLEDYKGE